MAEEDIGKDWTGDAINERIAQLTTAYSLRKNVAERESGAAFRKPIIPPLTTPGIEDSETS